MLKPLLITVGLCLVPATALAHGDHAMEEGPMPRGPHGGLVKQMGDYDGELVLSVNSVSLYLLDLKTGGAVPTKDMQANITFVQGGVRKGALALAPAGDHLQGKGPVPAGANAVVELRTKNGKSTQVRFDNP